MKPVQLKHAALAVSLDLRRMSPPQISAAVCPRSRGICEAMADDPAVQLLCVNRGSQGPRSSIKEELAATWLQGPEAETLQRSRK